MKDFSVTFGGKDRPLKYTSKDMKELQRTFGFDSPVSFVIGSVLGVNISLGSNTQWDIRAQHEFLAKGLARGAGRPITADHVEGWWDDAIANSIPIKPILWEAVRAAYWAGVLTMESVDIEAEGRDLKGLFFSKDLADVLKIATMEAPALDSSSTSPHQPIAASDTP